MLLYTFDLKAKLCLIHLFFVFVFEYSVHIFLFNKCIYENIAVLNNEIMSSKMDSKRPLS